MLYNVHPTTIERTPWKVEWRYDGVRHRKFFSTKEKAEGWAEKRNIEAQNSGVNALTFPEELRIEATRAMALLKPYGKSILEAVAAAIPIWEASRTSKKVEDAVEALIADKRADGKSKRYILDLNQQLRKFVKAFHGKTLEEITPSEIREFVRSIPLGPVSRNNCRRAVSVLFAFGVQNEWCRDNPAKKVKAATEPRLKIGILAPEEAATLLFHAPEYAKAHLAIGLFCGLRRSELERVGPDSIKWRSGLVEVAVTKTRGAAHRFVRIRQNLRAWLLGFPIRVLTPDELRRGLADAVDGAGLRPWPHNAVRHSFCSYALAHEHNLNDLTLEMGHTNPQTLFAHYRELVTPEDAAIYWRLTPARVNSICSQRRPIPQ